MELFKKCEKFVSEKGIIENRDKILVSVSGGPDSIFLLYFLLYLRNKYNFSLFVSYIHHHLRKQADKEFMYVKEISKKYGIPFYYRNIKIEGKTGIEEKSREKRYKALYQIAKKTGVNKIATGHTLDDNIESVLLNFFRGSGLAGMSGILPERKIYKNSNIFLIRPILIVRKSEIKKFLNKKGIKYYLDKSNLNLKYRRNLIRYKIIPYLKKFFPSFTDIIAKTSSILQDDFLYIEKEAIKTLELILKNGQFNVSEFKKIDISIRRFIVQLLFEKIAGVSYRSYNKIENLRNFIEGIKESYVPISIIEERIKGEKKERKIYKVIEIPGKYNVDGIFIESEYIKKSPFIFKNMDKYTGYFDGEKVRKKIIVRSRKKGDMFQPLGMQKEKKLSRFLIDRKIPIYKRDKILIFQSKNEIMWVCGVEISEKFKITEETKKILKIKVNV